MQLLRNRPIALVCLLALIAAAGLVMACGGDDDNASATATHTAAPTSTAAGATSTATPVTIDYSSLSGDIVVDGSSTVYPITQAAAEEFGSLAPNVRASVGIAGTGGGFKKFCAGETDISDASRPISPTEVQLCADENIQYIELPVAYDGLSVVVNKNNAFVDCLTVAELKKMWEPAAQGTVTNWNQIRSSFPDKPLALYGPGTDSGTFDYFTEAINGKAKDSRGDYQASEDDNVLVQGVSGDENALGYFGFAYYVENSDKLKLVKIDPGTGNCLAPSFEAIQNASYQPLSRPLFIYIKKEAAARPEVKGFVEFYLGKSFTPLIPSREIGYVALVDKYYTASANRFAAGTLGTLWPNGAEVGATLDRYLGN
jgi:phosphate binding protein